MKTKCARRFASCCANVNGTGTQGGYAECYQTFSARSRILGKQGRVPYLRHRHSILVKNTQIAELVSRHFCSYLPLFGAEHLK